jgi:hypothetical protein
MESYLKQVMAQNPKSDIKDVMDFIRRRELALA